MLFRTLAFILTHLPSFLERVVFELFYPIYLIEFWKEKKYVAERLKSANLQIKPKAVYKNLFLNGVDSLRFLQNKEIPLKFENSYLVKDEIGKNPIVFMSIHLGAFEMLHRSLEHLTTSTVNLVVSEFRNAKLDEFLTSLRATQKIRIAKDYDVPKILKNAIRSKEILAVMADQSKGKAENFKILGDDVPLFLDLPLTANKLGASIVLFITFRKKNEHIIRFERVYAPKSEIDKKEIAKILENWILKYPEQWAWNYGYIKR
ncbi:MAG: lysophospholipid acyltransferase family protein [Fibromonadaceae bacterium]|jgi:KDO2-lipid IV(A) lauroyltransferase|nr:lysophospholipid acyltransferase family protein [Fibromonadaceae bacterium]